MKPRIRKKLVIVCKYTLMIFVTVILTFPIMWLLLGSIKPSDELFQTPPTFLPQQLSLASYVFVFQHTDLLRNLLNSLAVASKWSMLDVFIIALVILVADGRLLTGADIRIGVIVFSASVLISTWAVRRLSLLAGKG